MIAILIKVLAFCGACSWVSCILPSQHGNSFVQLFLDAANVFGGNIHRGKNKDDARV